jgi:hypothetical protein
MGSQVVGEGGIVVEGAIEVFPGRHAWHDGGLVEEVEG